MKAEVATITTCCCYFLGLVAENSAAKAIFGRFWPKNDQKIAFATEFFSRTPWPRRRRWYPARKMLKGQSKGPFWPSLVKVSKDTFGLKGPERAFTLPFWRDFNCTKNFRVAERRGGETRNFSGDFALRAGKVKWERLEGSNSIWLTMVRPYDHLAPISAPRSRPGPLIGGQDNERKVETAKEKFQPESTYPARSWNLGYLGPSPVPESPGGQ